MDLFFAIGVAAIGLGTILSVIGNIWLLVLAFREGLGWGLAAMFIPFAMLVFMIMYFGDTWQPTAINFLGFVISIMGFLVLYFVIGPEAFLTLGVQ